MDWEKFDALTDYAKASVKKKEASVVKVKAQTFNSLKKRLTG